MNWIKRLFMSSKEKDEIERKRIEAEHAEEDRRWLEGKKRHEQLLKEQKRIRNRIAKGIPTTGFDVRKEVRAEQRKNDSIDDLLNPLNPLSPISPISVWNNDDNNHTRNSSHDHSSHHHSSHDDHSSSSYDGGSSYDSGSSDSGGCDSGGGD